MESVQVQGNPSGPEDPNAPAQEPIPNDDFQVPDKFIGENGEVDLRSLVNSYTELERMRSQPQAPEEGDKPSAISDNDYSDILTAVGNGQDLTEEQYAAYEAKGLSREFMDAFVEGQRASMNQKRAEVFGMVGGEQAYNDMVAWAGQNLTEAEIKAYDDAMMSGDMGQIKLHMQGLSARYTQATNRPRMVHGNVSQNNAAGAFQSWAQVTQAMRDPRYQADPAYRKTVEQRLAVTKTLQ